MLRMMLQVRREACKDPQWNKRQGSPKERSSSLANSRIKESLEGSKDKTIELALVPE